MPDDLDVIEDGRLRKVEYNGRTIEVRPLTIGQLPGFTRAIKPAMPLLFSNYEELAAKDPAVIMDLVAEHADQLREAVSIAVSVKARDLAEGTVAEFTELTAAVIAVNLDFFVRRLVPLVEETAELLSGAGRTPSSASSKRATGGKKSTATR